MRATGLAGFCFLASLLARGQVPTPSTNGVAALGAIVGVWQSDVTNGVSARSACAWTPQHTAVVCDQTITTPQGEQHATNIYAYDPAAGKYTYYGLSHAGDRIEPVVLTIVGPVWTYGGQTAAADGLAYRTINDFSGTTFYTWRRESSRDGKTWTTLAQGRSERVSK